MQHKTETRKPETAERGRAVRTCLRCNDRFNSAWHGERICRRCKSSDDWGSPAQLEGVALGTNFG